MSVIIPKQFNGPPESGNGGYVAGVAADMVSDENGIFEVMLKAPPPLDTPLGVSRTDDGLVRILEGEKPVVEARLIDSLDLEIPAFHQRAKEPDGMVEVSGGFNVCFVCGTDRKPGDGLCLYSERQPAPSNHWIAPFTIHPSFCNENGIMKRRFIVSALDCPGYAAASNGELSVLARFRFHVTGELKAGDKAEVHAWPISSSGRKRVAGTAVLNPDGDVIAVAEALWIVIRPDQLRAAS